MSTKIEWTDEVWNPIAGCMKISPGCENCYAERMAKRLAAMGKAPYTNVINSKGRWTRQVEFAGDGVLLKPFRWREPRMVFVNSMSDLFQSSLVIPDSRWMIDQAFAVMALTPRHTFQVLTKRANLMHWYMTGEGMKNRVLQEAQNFSHILAKSSDGWDDGVAVLNGKMAWPLPNVWLGVSVENQECADARIPFLLHAPAAVRFVSCEPLLGAVNLRKVHDAGNQVIYDALGGSRFDYDSEGIGCRAPMPTRLDWVIVGGESGAGARPMQAEWARGLRDQCQETGPLSTAGTAFFFKQWGGVKKNAAGRLLDGREWNEMPRILQGA